MVSCDEMSRGAMKQVHVQVQYELWRHLCSESRDECEAILKAGFF